MSVNFRASVAIGFLLCLAAGPAATQSAFQFTPPVGDVKTAGPEMPSLAFEQNLGQLDKDVRYVARGPGYRVLLTGKEAALVFEGKSGTAPMLRMSLENANAVSAPKGEQLLPHKTNYLVSGDAERNITGVPSHGRVRYESVYPGIDLVYYGKQGKLEYDFVVAPGADPSRIGVVFSGPKPAITAGGELSIAVEDVQLSYHPPVAYQEIEGRRVAVDARYVVAERGTVHFALGEYDRTQPLVIDPLLAYSSGAWSGASAITVDAAGNAYITGGAIGSSIAPAGTYQTRVLGAVDVYVAKLDPTGKSILWATYIGGRKASSSGVGISVDAGGNVYVAGTTDMGAYPVTAGAYQTTFASAPGSFVTKLNPNGTALVYSTFVNGATVTGMALDTGGNVFLTGNASALATTPGAYQTAGSGSFVAKLNAAGSAMVYATTLGGANSTTTPAMAIDGAGNAYVTGTTTSTSFPLVNAFRTSLGGPSDAFALKLNSTGSALVYSTYLGGSYHDEGHAIAVDSSGQAYVAGIAWSENFPTTPGSFQPRKGYASESFANGFITKLNASGSSPVYSSYIGGRWCVRPGVSSCSGSLTKTDGDGVSAIAIDAAGYAYVGGYAISGVFPAADPIADAPAYYSDYIRVVFFAKVNPTGDGLVYFSVLGDQRDFINNISSVAADNAGGAFFTGNAGNVPFTAGALAPGNGGGFILKISPGRYPTTVSSSANPATTGQTVTLLAQVQNPQAGGTVTFYDGASVLGTAGVVGGRSTLSVSFTPGIRKITAMYSGDALASPPLFQVVRGQ